MVEAGMDTGKDSKQVAAKTKYQLTNLSAQLLTGFHIICNYTEFHLFVIIVNGGGGLTAGGVGQQRTPPTDRQERRLTFDPDTN